VRVRISTRAEDDLARIYAHLLTCAGSEVAERFRLKVEKAFATIGRHPELGPQPSWATRHRTLRFWVISRTSYIVYYEHQGDKVSIERVLYGRRDVHRIIEQRGEEPEDETAS
jgi:plasmid stabilization system protein ParE